MKLRTAILGSSGFIGSHLVNFLSPKRFEIYGADLQAGHAQPAYFETLNDPKSLVQFLASQDFDLVINCIGSANVQSSYDDPARDFELNAQTVLTILESLRKKPSLPKFINLSSAAVYGNPEVTPVSESESKRPISPYGLNKSIAEDIASTYFRIFKVPTCSLRIFSAYGPCQRKLLFWDIHKKVLQSKDRQIDLFGTGRETRDFIFVLDLVSAIETVALKAPFEGECINVASGRSIDIQTAAQKLLEALAPDVKIRFTGNIKVGDPFSWCADIRLLSTLGFQPKFTFEQGIRQTAEWLKQESI